MKQPGRKSAAQVAVLPIDSGVTRYNPPSKLGTDAKQLWRNICSNVPDNFFTPADLGLLEELCKTQCELLPQMDEKIEREGITNQNLAMRSMLVKQLAMLGGKLRLVVNARTRGDLASMRDLGKNSITLDWGKLDADT